MAIGYNDDQNPHTLTMDTSGSNAGSTPSFDSGIIILMGQCVHQFSEPGTYEYYDSTTPHAKGTVVVGYSYQLGTNIDTLVGGNVLSFNASQLETVWDLLNIG